MDLVTQPCELLVEHRMEMPVGGGYGMSGSAALSLSLALNEALEAGLSRIEAAQIAHVAEIHCQTGLGTVLAETFGGVEVRDKPGAPGVGSVIKVPTKPGCKVFSAYLGPLYTKRFLNRRGFAEKVNSAGGSLIDKLVEDPSVERLLDHSRRFSEELNLYTPRLRRLMRGFEAHGVRGLTMNLFGEALFTIGDATYVERCRRVGEALAPSATLIVTDIEESGARLLE